MRLLTFWFDCLFVGLIDCLFVCFFLSLFVKFVCLCVLCLLRVAIPLCFGDVCRHMVMYGVFAFCVFLLFEIFSVFVSVVCCADAATFFVVVSEFHQHACRN